MIIGAYELSDGLIHAANVRLRTASSLEGGTAKPLLAPKSKAVPTFPGTKGSPDISASFPFPEASDPLLPGHQPTSPEGAGIQAACTLPKETCMQLTIDTASMLEGKRSRVSTVLIENAVQSAINL